MIIAIYESEVYLGLDLLSRMELKTLDYRFLLRGVQEPDKHIVIVGIDERSLDNIKDPMIFWRPHFAKVIKRIADAGARVIGMDFIFSIPLNKEIEGIDHDKIMALALKEANNVILAKTFKYDKERDAYIITEPISRLRFSADPKSAGFVNLVTDSDNCVRRQTLLIKDINGQGHASFGLVILSKFLYKLNKGQIVARERSVVVGDKIIPTNRYTEMLINFAGPSGTFPHISFYEVWKKADEDDHEYFKTHFRDKIVLIGTTNILHQDFNPTPFFGSKHYRELRSTYGIEIWANMINTILKENYIIGLSNYQIALIILFFGLIVSYLSLRLSFIWGLIFIPLIGLGYINGCIFLFILHNLWLDLVAPFLVIPLTYGAIFTYRYTIENKQRAIIKNLFQFYLHPSVVNELLKDPEAVKLGGVKKELTIFFSDIANFTSISEAMEPEELVNLINIYLTEMSNIIIAHEGTIDKYEGDAIMAFFGAPLDQADHAIRACYSALETQKHLIGLRERFKAKGWPEINIRIGINTGPVVVGNMGGENRFDYTVLGDGVNLAARLEAANKTFFTNIMIGEYTYELAKDSIVGRELDIIRVKGKSMPVKVYELIAKKGEIDQKTLELLKNFGDGLDAYRKQDWATAIKYFGNAIQIKPEDGPSRLYLTRCADYLKSPPPPQWDGVYEMKTK